MREEPSCAAKWRERTSVQAFVGVVALVATTASNAQLSFEAEKPAFHVQIPRLPAMTMGEHPGRVTQPHLRLLGSKEQYTVSVLVPSTEAGMSAAECASSTISQLPKRLGVPPQERIYKARIDSNTYIAIYARPMSGFVQLHAHLLSAVGGSHCVEVHASMVSTSKDDLEPWFRGFGDARIEPQ
jgi:hypothetical protein